MNIGRADARCKVGPSRGAIRFALPGRKTKGGDGMGELRLDGWNLWHDNY